MNTCKILNIKDCVYIFQCLLLQKQWEEGLQAMDQAITDMPRTNHRLYVI